MRAIPRGDAHLLAFERLETEIAMRAGGEEGREEVRRLIEDTGSRATPEAPLAWLSMEPGTDQTTFI